MSLALWLSVVGGLGWFFARMAQLEPLTGDGWYNADDISSGLSAERLVEQLSHLHNHGNPRIGQAFTLITYGSRAFHLIATPLVLLALIVMVATHALGRLPRPLSIQDGLCVLASAAGCFLAVPQPGHAFFYRPITTNYLYTLTLSLVFFIPLRLGLSVRRPWLACMTAVLMLGFGLFIGKTNEHTGPTMILVAAIYTALAWRQKAMLEVVWRAAMTVGLLIGYLLLFFAPGQSERYGALGRQSVLQTILDRGVRGTAELLGEYCGYVGPLLLGVSLIILLCLALEPASEIAERFARVRWTVLGYVVLSCLVLGTAFAAPKNHYRLFIAPAVLLVIASVAALRMIGGRWVLTLLGVMSATVCAGMMLIFVPMFTEIHEDELARNALIRQANPHLPIVVPRTRYAKRDAFYYGDSITADPRHRDRMARLFKVREIKVAPKNPPAPSKPKLKPATKTPAKQPARAPEASPPEVEDRSADTPNEP